MESIVILLLLSPFWAPFIGLVISMPISAYRKCDCKERNDEKS